MTESTRQEPAEDAAAEPAVDAEILAEVEDAARATEQRTDDLARIRDELDDLRSRLSDADGLTSSTQQLLVDLRLAADALAGERRQLEREKASFVAREQQVASAEHKRDQGYADERAALEREITLRRAEVLAALEAELTAVRVSRLAEVTDAENTERQRVRAAIQRERAEWDDTRAQQQHVLSAQHDELARQKGAVSALRSELEGRRVELEENERDVERRRARHLSQAQRRSEHLDEELAERVADERKTFGAALQASRDEAGRLLETIQSQSALIGAFEHLQQQLGGRDPGSVILELNTLRDELKLKAEELATRPTEEHRARFNAMESDLRTSRNRVDQLRTDLERQKELAAQAITLKEENRNLEAALQLTERRARNFEADANATEAQLNRLRAAYERPLELEARYNEIELPRVGVQDVTLTTHGDVTEDEWLQSIVTASDQYGLHFNPRILKAFHTALKTAEWSPLTILAGVSGTGKSELPRLYSHFGGLYFEPLSVQPNWDSQESMLGFFNSIDNRFDAQPVLRFLAQSQKPWEAATGELDGYPGLANAVCLVLLDEMNLAHPELYFAEFLSKLELRRGKKGSDVPTLPVKIGAGMKPYELPLGRNVLWAGTMNQDETTKSLSDKVLDRAIVIHFPRPTDLKRRQRLTPLDARNRGDNLSVQTWQSWLVKESTFTEDEVKPYKAFVEEMNDSLAVAGRAIGHRVWQTVEYYMANYPDVRSAGDDSAKKAQAMHLAFEDQLVQKVMPKLRGIDTRVTSKSRIECLDKIRGQLVAGIGGAGFNLAEDFDLAMDLGYGQFIWQSANYLKVDSSDEPA